MVKVKELEVRAYHRAVTDGFGEDVTACFSLFLAKMRSML
jgi:hypothetical protein